MKKRVFFVTGTDTGVGKTFITAMLARKFYDEGNSVITQKWVQTGCDSVSEDIMEHRSLSGNILPSDPDLDSLISPYILRYPASPHLSAKIDNVIIEKTKILDAFSRLSSKFDVILIEGSGGVLVPFNEKDLLIDIVKDINIPVILVAENRLGAINQTLLSISALKQRDMEIAGIIFNNVKFQDEDIVLKDNPGIIEKLSGVPVLGEIGFHKNRKEGVIAFSGIYKELEKRLK